MEIKLELTSHQIQQLREIIDRHPLVDRATGESYHMTIVTVSKALPMQSQAESPSSLGGDPGKSDGSSPGASYSSKQFIEDSRSWGARLEQAHQDWEREFEANQARLDEWATRQ